MVGRSMFGGRGVCLSVAGGREGRGGREPAHILLPFSLEEVYRRRPPFLLRFLLLLLRPRRRRHISSVVAYLRRFLPLPLPGPQHKREREGDAGQTWGRTEMVQKKEFKTCCSCARLCNTGAYLWCSCHVYEGTCMPDACSFSPPCAPPSASQNHRRRKKKRRRRRRTSFSRGSSVGALSSSFISVYQESKSFSLLLLGGSGGGRSWKTGLGSALEGREGARKRAHLRRGGGGAEIKKTGRKRRKKRATLQESKRGGPL